MVNVLPPNTPHLLPTITNGVSNVILVNSFPEFFLGSSLLYAAIFAVIWKKKIKRLPTIMVNVFIFTLFFSFILLAQDGCKFDIAFFKISNIKLLEGQLYSVSTQKADYLGHFYRVIIHVVTIVYAAVILNGLQSSDKINKIEYPLILNLSTIALLLICVANNYLSAYLALELQGLSLYVLASSRRLSFNASRSGLVYFILGSVSSGFLLLGVSFIYGLFGSVDFDRLSSLSMSFWNVTGSSRPRNLFGGQNDYVDLFASLTFDRLLWYSERLHIKALFLAGKGVLNNDFEDIDGLQLHLKSSFIVSNDPSVVHERALLAESVFELTDYSDLIYLMSLLVLISLGFKLTLAPFHSWAPNVYENSPSPSAFYFSVVPKIGVFVLFFRFSFSVMGVKNLLKYPFSVMGLLSIFAGSFGGVGETRLKSLLTYSSITHTAFIVLSFCGNGAFFLEMTFYYLNVYIFSALALWSALHSIRLKSKKYSYKINKNLGDFTLLVKTNKYLALFLTVAFFSLAGLPPTSGFTAKLKAFLSLMCDIDLRAALIFTTLMTSVSIFFYIRIVKSVNFEHLTIGKLFKHIFFDNSFVLAILIYTFFFIFCNPNYLSGLCKKLANLFHAGEYIVIYPEHISAYYPEGENKWRPGSCVSCGCD